MSYGDIYVESDIALMKSAGYSKKFIIRIISRRIKYRYDSMPMSDAKRIATEIYEGKNSNWRTKRKSDKEIMITAKEKKLWNKLGLGDL